MPRFWLVNPAVCIIVCPKSGGQLHDSSPRPEICGGTSPVPLVDTPLILASAVSFNCYITVARVMIVRPPLSLCSSIELSARLSFGVAVEVLCSDDEARVVTGAWLLLLLLPDG